MSLTEVLKLVAPHQVVKVVNRSGIGAARILCDEKDVWTADEVLDNFYCGLYEVYMLAATAAGNICIYVYEYDLKEE